MNNDYIWITQKDWGKIIRSLATVDGPFAKGTVKSVSTRVDHGTIGSLPGIVFVIKLEDK